MKIMMMKACWRYWWWSWWRWWDIATAIYVQADPSFGKNGSQMAREATKAWIEIGDINKPYQSWIAKDIGLPVPPAGPPPLELLQEHGATVAPKRGAHAPPKKAPAKRKASVEPPPPPIPLIRVPVPPAPQQQVQAPRTPPAPPQRVQIEQRVIVMETCPCCGGNGEIQVGSNDWASFIQTPDTLVSTMKYLQIDGHAQLQTTLFIQEFGDVALSEVNSILSNILKNWKYVGNQSAFLSSSVIKLRHTWSDRRPVSSSSSGKA